jgi:hypothetical protein
MTDAARANVTTDEFAAHSEAWRGLTNDPGARDQMATLSTEEQLIDYTAAPQRAQLLIGRTPGAEGSTATLATSVSGPNRVQYRHGHPWRGGPGAESKQFPCRDVDASRHPRPVLAHGQGGMRSSATLSERGAFDSAARLGSTPPCHSTRCSGTPV